MLRIPIFVLYFSLSLRSLVSRWVLAINLFILFPLPVFDVGELESDSLHRAAAAAVVVLLSQYYPMYRCPSRASLLFTINSRHSFNVVHFLARSYWNFVFSR